MYYQENHTLILNSRRILKKQVALAVVYKFHYFYLYLQKLIKNKEEGRVEPQEQALPKRTRKEAEQFDRRKSKRFAEEISAKL